MTNILPPAPLAGVSKAIKGVTQSRFLDRVPLLWSRGYTAHNGYFPPANDPGATSRLLFQVPSTYAMHDPQVVFANYVASNTTSEAGASPNPITISGTLEYPANTFHRLTFNGKKYVTLQPGAWIKSDQLGIDIPAGAQVWVRTYYQVALTPLTPTAIGSTSGGTLAAGSWYYKITSVCGDQGESGPTSELTVTTTGSTSSVALGWSFDSRSVASTAINIYRGTASGGEHLLATLPGGTTSWTDTGALTVGTISPPSTGQLLSMAGNSAYGPTRTGEGYNGVSYGAGPATDATTTTGTAWITNAGINVYGPAAVIATPDVGFDVPVIGQFGDSILFGQNSISEEGYLSYALINNTPSIPYFYAPYQGETMAYAATAAYDERIQFASGVTDAICEYGINDIYINATTLAALQANSITFWQRLAKRALRVWQTTLGPRTGSTDNFATAGNQLKGGGGIGGATNASPIVINGSTLGMTSGNTVTIKGVGGNTAANGSFYLQVVDSFHFALYSDSGLTQPVAGNGAYTSGGVFSYDALEAVRVGFNTWIRAGAPVTISGSTITAVAVGTSGAITAGQAGHPLYGTLDYVPAAVEVNSSNVLTLNGGYWLTNGTANYYSEGTHPSVNAVPLIAAVVNTALFTTP